MPRSLVAALLAAALLISGAPVASAVTPPASDPFYVPPAGFEQTTPGTVLRQRSVTVTGLGIPIPVRSTQFLVRSADAHDRPVAVASTVMVPLTPYPGTRPLLSYQQAIDSLGDQCNPSYTLRTGTMQEMALLAQGLMRGWAVVTTDFQGPRNAYGAGRMAGHAVLDGIRAARSHLGNVPVGMWGYSGGGQATAWAAELAPTYAPELPIVGAAQGGVPADLTKVIEKVDGTVFSGVVFAAVFATAREYPELNSLLNDHGRATAERIADMCQAELAVTLAGRHLNEFTVSPNPLAEPVAQSVLADNALGTRAPTTPVFLFHAYFDQLIPVAVGRQLKADYCAGGTKVSYYEDYVTEHIGLDITAAPLAVSYLADRFAGRPAPSNC
jgi:pimeloyl-ACP methyl ester carboxylesterase